MLSDRFFTEYAKTGQPVQAAAGDPEVKDTYTAAEVDTLVNNRVQDAIEQITAKFNQAGFIQQGKAAEQQEGSVQNGNTENEEA